MQQSQSNVWIGGLSLAHLIFRLKECWLSGKSAADFNSIYLKNFFFTLLFNVYAVRDLFVLSGNQLFKWKILQSGASTIQEKVMPVKLC